MDNAVKRHTHLRAESAKQDGAPTQGFAEIDQEIWEMIGDIVSAAHRSDAQGFALATQNLTRTLTLGRQRVAGLYILYLLRYRVAAVIGNRPSREDLRELAMRVYPEFAKIIREDSDQLERTLLTAFKLVSPDAEVEGGDFAVSSSVALGVLLREPASDLEAMRSYLGEWCRDKEDAIRAVAASTT